MFSVSGFGAGILEASGRHEKTLIREPRRRFREGARLHRL
jgi:hypothetical protein